MFTKFLGRVFYDQSSDGGAGGGSGSGGSGAGAGASGSAGGANSSGNAGSGNGTSGGGSGNGGSDWTSGLAEDEKGYIANKGFKQPGEVLKAYRELEKTFGAPKERLLIKPEKEDDAAAMGEFYNKLGRPGSPNDYELDLPKEGADKDFTDWAKTAFHKHGLTKKQASELAKDYMGFNANRNDQQVKANGERLENEDKALKKEWGAAYEQNKNIAQRAINVFGIDQAKLEKLEGSLGSAETAKLFQKIGERLGEDKFVSSGGRQGVGAMTPDAARAEIARLRSDPTFVKNFGAGDGEAVKRMNDLHLWAFPQE